VENAATDLPPIKKEISWFAVIVGTVGLGNEDVMYEVFKFRVQMLNEVPQSHVRSPVKYSIRRPQHPMFSLLLNKPGPFSMEIIVLFIRMTEIQRHLLIARIYKEIAGN
jgi:hypothetical protein